MTERIIPILRKEYKDATEEIKKHDQDPNALDATGQELYARAETRARQKGRLEAIGNIVKKLNQEFGTNYRKDATKNPSKKKKR